MAADKKEVWYYASPDKQQQGPFSLEKLRSLAQEGLVTHTTSVWCLDFPDWIPASEVSGLHDVSAQRREPRSTVEIPDPVPFETKSLKPLKGTFLFPRIISLLVACGIICGMIGGLLVVVEVPFWPAAAGFIFLVGLGIAANIAAYRKERYVLESSRLTCHKGGLFSDQTSEFEIRNITHVKIVLPWLRFKFFGIGNVIIETAGTSKPMVMYAIEEPEATYAEIRELMKRNGYDLTQSQLLHQEKPALIGVLAELVSFFIGAAFLGIFSLGGLVELLKNSNADLTKVFLLGLLALLPACIIVFIILRIMDYRRRTYSVFNDVVVYEEGFLTRHNAFIPYENIADSNTKCSLLDRMLGLFDVQVSCQGSSKEIKFRRLRNGIALSGSIDELVLRANQKPKPTSKQAGAENTVAKRVRREEPEIVRAENSLVAEFRMHGGRVMIPLLLLLPLFPLWIFAMIQALIKVTSTRYFVRSGSLRHSYRFLTVHDREFSYDKITGLVIKTNPWDKMFGTMTLKFWSIGSGKPLEFAHVHRSLVDLPALMRQIGIPADSPDPYSARVAFSFPAWIRAGMYWFLLLLLVTAGIIVCAVQFDQAFYYLLAVPAALVVGCFIRAKLYYSRQRLRFHDHHVEAEQGIIAKRCYYVRYRNIKRLRTIKYPGGTEGDLRIFVAGEEEVYPQSREMKGRQPILKQCSFSSGMLQGIQASGLLLDDILSGRINPSAVPEALEPCETVIESPRSAATAVAALILLSIVLFPLIVLLPITIPLTIVRVKRWRYRIDEARISMSWGILFRKQESVILDRVDSLQQYQGPLNKVFGNGKVSIMTAGSSKPDLVISDSPRYIELYKAIRERTQ